MLSPAGRPLDNAKDLHDLVLVFKNPSHVWNDVLRHIVETDDQMELRWLLQLQQHARLTSKNPVFHDFNRSLSKKVRLAHSEAPVTMRQTVDNCGQAYLPTRHETINHES